MSATSDPRSRRYRLVILSIAIGLAIVVIGLLMLGFRAITTPSRAAILKYGAIACAASASGSYVDLQITLAQRGSNPLLDGARLLGAKRASLLHFGWLKPPTGYGAGEIGPSALDIRTAFSGSEYPRRLPASSSNLVLRIAAESTGISSAEGVELLLTTGEPQFRQLLKFDLKVDNGQCSVQKT